MIPAPRLERLAALVEAVSGIVFSAGQLVHLRELMTRRAAQLGMDDLGAYLLALEQGRLDEEWRLLLPAITVKESYLFRIPEQFRALGERILPELVRARSAAGAGAHLPLRFWSAGCANGEEPATLAVVLAEAGLPPASWSILATDVDERALQQAATGVFSARAVSQVPPELLSRYFTSRPAGWELDGGLQRRIELRRVNLVREPFPDLGGPFDLVFLRNVLIYFRPESQRRVVEAVTDNLAADGLLFLGHSESLWQLSARLGPVDLGGCFAYRHAATGLSSAPSGAAAAAEDPARRGEASPRAARVGREGAAPATTERRRATRRPSTPPRERTPVPAPASRSAPPVIPASSLTAAVAALAADSPLEALAMVSQRLVAVPQDAAAHALLGLLKDLRGDGEGALAAYRAALFLRPHLYRVRLLLAERLRLAGWRDRARTEYRQVLATLEAGGEDLPELAEALGGDHRDVAGRCRLALSRL